MSEERARPEERPRWRRWLRRGLLGLALGALVAVPWWGPAVLQRLEFFNVRQVVVEGTRYLEPGEVVRRLEVDTLRSVWEELAPLERRVATHPQVQAVRVRRRLPGTLVVQVQERQPVAFVPATEGGRLEVRDVAGNVLPIDPSRARIDLPVLAEEDTLLLRLLGELQAADPVLYRNISEVRRTGGGRDEIVLRLYSTTVRARSTVSATRLADIRPVEADLARRQLRAAELDLRFRDQVIARLQ